MSHPTLFLRLTIAKKTRFNSFPLGTYLHHVHNPFYPRKVPTARQVSDLGRAQSQHRSLQASLPTPTAFCSRNVSNRRDDGDPKVPMIAERLKMMSLSSVPEACLKHARSPTMVLRISQPRQDRSSMDSSKASIKIRVGTTSRDKPRKESRRSTFRQCASMS